MNNDKAYYESEEFWSTAPEGAQGYIPDNKDWYATFWKRGEDNSLWYQYEKPEHWMHHGWYARTDCYPVESLDFYIERPTFPNKKTADAQPWIPSVGEECCVEFENGLTYDGVIVALTKEYVILDVSGEEVPFVRGYTTLKPIPKEKTIQEKMLDKWQRQSLDYAHDTTSSQYTLGSVFNFVVKNFNVEDKEEN